MKKTMGREIKFRAWHAKRKEMFSALEMGEDQLTLSPDGRGFINVHSVSTRLSHYITDMIPMQYTGLRDKNGKEIYEGDIVKINMGRFNRDILEVKWGGYWEHAGFGLHGKRIDKEDWESEYSWDDINPYYAKDCEIIGNIYENKDVLEIKGTEPSTEA